MRQLGQHTGKAVKSLATKRVQFVEPVLHRSVRNIGGYIAGVRELLWINKGLSIAMRKGTLSVKRIGATQTFQRRTFRTKGFNVEDQEVSQIVKDLIFGNKYSGPFRE